ncbi:hypothetical protein C8R44DRAFT_903382, partial [Mycena epipterygia]
CNTTILLLGSISTLRATCHSFGLQTAQWFPCSVASIYKIGQVVGSIVSSSFGVAAGKARRIVSSDGSDCRDHRFLVHALSNFSCDPTHPCCRPVVYSFHLYVPRQYIKLRLRGPARPALVLGGASIVARGPGRLARVFGGLYSKSAISRSTPADPCGISSRWSRHGCEFASRSSGVGNPRRQIQTQCGTQSASHPPVLPLPHDRQRGSPAGANAQGRLSAVLLDNIRPRRGYLGTVARISHRWRRRRRLSKRTASCSGWIGGASAIPSDRGWWCRRTEFVSGRQKLWVGRPRYGCTDEGECRWKGPEASSACGI